MREGMLVALAAVAFLASGCSSDSTTPAGSGAAAGSSTTGSCPPAAEVSAALGLAVMFVNEINHTCSYGKDTNNQSVYIRYSFDVTAEAFTQNAGGGVAKPLAGFGDQAYVVTGGSASSMIAVLKGTTSITLAAPVSLDTAEAYMNTLLSRV